MAACHGHDPARRVACVALLFLVVGSVASSSAFLCRAPYISFDRQRQRNTGTCTHSDPAVMILQASSRKNRPNKSSSTRGKSKKRNQHGTRAVAKEVPTTRISTSTPSAVAVGVAVAVAVADPHQHPLLDWLSTMPGTQVDNIELRRSELGDGLGGYATKPIQDGQVVFVVPSEAFISVSTALTHPQLGPQMWQLWQDSKGTDSNGSTVLAGFIAHVQLNKDKDACHVYPDMLPKKGPNEKHALWWSEEEVELLRGSTAHDALVELRQDVDDSIATLTSVCGVLAADVEKHGAAAVDEAVRAGFVSILSRTYAVYSTEGRDYRTLIPLLDALNHAEPQNIQYSFHGQAGEAGMSGILVATAIGPIKKGAELTISYGQHPAHIFATHYGFVPSTYSRYVTLKLGAHFDATTSRIDIDRSTSGDDLILSIPASTFLNAQKEIEEDSYDHGDSTTLGMDDWTALCESHPTAALAALLDGRSPCTSRAEVGEQFHPFVFGVEDTELIARRTPGNNGNGNVGLEALRLCARLLSMASNTGHAEVKAALGMLLSSPLNDIGNDVDAAQFCNRVALYQLGELEKTRVRLDEEDIYSSAGGAVRPDVVSMERLLVSSEADLLRELGRGDTGGLFPLLSV
eukprot:scaffold17213_cov57-Attheya_sp.AAC.2